MDYYELELARREEELEDMRQAERAENRFLLAIVAILSAGAGAALMLAVAALLALLFVLSFPSVTRPAPPPAASLAPSLAPSLTPIPTAVPTVIAALPLVQAEPAPTQTPAAAPSVAVPEAAPEAAPEASTNEFVSGGLGLARAEWEALYGPSIGVVNGAARYGTDGALTLDVVFLDDRVQSIDWQSAQSLTADLAMTSGQEFLPADVVLASSYAPPERPGSTVFVYESALLAQRLGSDPKWWRGGNPGTALLQYDLTPSGVSRMLLSTGSNP